MTAPSSVADFILIQAEGKSWFGKPNAGWAQSVRQTEEATAGLAVEPRRLPCVLSPVYEYSLLLVPGPQGQPQMQPNLRPPFGCLSVRSLRLPGASSGIWVAVADLSADEQRMFAQLYQATEDAVSAARAQAAGLTVVASNGQMPTRFGGGPRG